MRATRPLRRSTPRCSPAAVRCKRTVRTNSAAVAAAEKFYDENVTSRLPVVDDSVTFNVKSDGMGMKASGTAYIKTPFLRFAAIEKLPLLSTSQTDFGELQIAVGGNGGENIEVAIMLDITGSMCNTVPGQNAKAMHQRPQARRHEGCGQGSRQHHRLARPVEVHVQGVDRALLGLGPSVGDGGGEGVGQSGAGR